MNEKEKQLAIHYLNEYTGELGNNGCNDVPETLWTCWSKEEREKFVKEYFDYNGDPENYDPEHLHLPDFAIVGFLAHKLKQ